MQQSLYRYPDLNKQLFLIKLMLIIDNSALKNEISLKSQKDLQPQIELWTTDLEKYWKISDGVLREWLNSFLIKEKYALHRHVLTVLLDLRMCTVEYCTKKNIYIDVHGKYNLYSTTFIMWSSKERYNNFIQELKSFIPVLDNVQVEK